MKMMGSKFTFIALFLFLPLTTMGLVWYQFRSQSNYDRNLLIEESVQQLIEKSFPELKKVKIVLKKFESPEYFFATGVHNPWRSTLRRTYVLFYNPKIFEMNISISALNGILSHELVHIQGYTQLNLMELASLAIRYDLVGDEKFVNEFEKRTDKKSIELGYGVQLTEYRKWIYSVLTPDQEKRKRAQYLSPEEIEFYEKQISKAKI